LRNKIDLSLPPEAVFLNPWQDEGIALLRRPEFYWRPIAPALIEGFAVSAHMAIHDKITNFLAVTKKHRCFAQALEFNSVPVLLHKVSFRKSFVMAQDRLLLSGAAGARSLNSYRWENEGEGKNPEAELVAYFEACQMANTEADLPLAAEPFDPDLPFAIECRNTFNYFHFLTESLSQLCLLDGLDHRGPIFFHFPNAEEKRRPFARAFVDALFPDLADRVVFERTPKDYEKVLTAFDLLGGIFQAPDAVAAGLDALAPSNHIWKGREARVSAQGMLAANAVSSGLIALRERGLRAIQGQDFTHLPRRFFVGRDTRHSRSRVMQGEDLLFEHLQMFGFEYVVFESLSPAEQVAIMANAEMMVSYHGAGFANMIFANPDAYLIEVGTLQTAQFRWGDFWQHAHVSQCRYISFFADFNQADPLVEPNFSKDGIVPVAMSAGAVGQLMGFVVTLLGHVPDLPRVDDLLVLARQLFQVRAFAQAEALLAQHDKLCMWSVDLCLLKADCHKELDEPKSELVALDRAYKADRNRWQTLIRLIWCANRCKRPQVIRWALTRLQADFPERHDAFVSNHEWVRYVV
tara:strand:- start:150021 stop:151751 length:1731 start_codon:yes stop_codon:yes gene_type:complete